MRRSVLIVSIIVAVMITGTFASTAEAARPIQTLWGQFYLIANRLAFWDSFLDKQIANLNGEQPSSTIHTQMERIRQNAESIDSKLTPYLGERPKPTTIINKDTLEEHNAVNVDFGHSDIARESSVIGSDGLPLIAYSLSEERIVYVVHCGSSDCSTGNTNTELFDAYLPSVAIGDDGLPLISVTTSGEDGFVPHPIVLYHCNNVECTTNTQSTIASTNGDTSTFDEPWLYTDIAKGSDDKPIIAFYNKDVFDTGSDIGADGVQVAHCDTLDSCTVQIVDTPVNVPTPQDPLILNIDNDGLPVISWDGKIAKCGTIDCS